MKEYVFSNMHKGEEKQISEMIQKVFEEFVAPDYTDKGREHFMKFINPNTIRTRNTIGNSSTILCRDQDKIVGLIEVQGYKHILLLFVDGSYHNQGIARRLLSLAVQQSIENNPELKRLTVNASPFAVPVYCKLAFEKTGSEQVKDGIRYTPMELVVSPNLS